MFEKLVESLLEEYVSEWVDGLDAEKMKIAVFSGKVEFRDLTLKASALDKFQFPLRVKAGTLGRLTMKVPWKRLTTQAVTMQIHDLFLVVVPSHQEDLNRSKQQPQQRLEDMVADSYELRLRWAKQQAVRVRELVETNKNEETQRSADSSADAAGTWGLREKILHNIMDNVSFEFTNIHIRYEDTSLLIAQNPLALGLTIESITVQTTNANGHVTFIDRSQSHTPFVHKSLEMVKAGLYCDNTSSMQDLISVRRREPLASSYLVHPFNTTIKMTVNHDESTVFSIPRYQFIADISSINASVTPEQCNDLINIVNYVSTHELYLKRIHCRRKRPRVPIRHNARAWWKYALYGVQVMYSLQTTLFPSTEKISPSAISPTDVDKSRRCTWKLFTSLWFRRKEYIRLHKKQIQASSKKLTAGESNSPDRLRLNELEDELDVDTIVFFRLCAAQELELEESRHDSVKKLSNWKARWSARGHNAQSDTSPGHRRLDPLQKLLLYATISEQMHESSFELAAKKLEEQNSKTILFAIDIVVSSVTLALVEKQGNANNAVSALSSTANRDFVCFELQQFVFAIFQRATACTISSSIQSVQMVDFSHDMNGDDSQPQVLFYALPTASNTEQLVGGETQDVVSAPADLQTTKKFVQLTIDSSETKFKLDCNFEPFRYIHNLTVATKLQAYFITQVDVSPALKENAEEAFAHSSVWINRAVFANNGGSKKNSTDTNGNEKRHSSNAIKPRIVEFSVRLPEVDLLVLSSEVSPVLEATLQDLHFKSGNLLDTFVFSVDGVEILFHDRISSEDMVAETQTRSSSGKRVLQHQHALREVNAGTIPVVHVVPRGYDLSRRKHSTILRKTRIEFLGEKIVQRNRAPKWLMRCTAPPIYFTLSSAQYHQVLQASASWASSSKFKPAITTTESAPMNADSSSASKLSKSEPLVAKKPKLPEFDPDDERFGLSILIPQILVVLEGGQGIDEFVTSCDPAKTIKNDKCDLEIDLVLDIKQVNVEARFTSVAQAVALDLQSLTFFKQHWTQNTMKGSDFTSKVRMTTQQAIAKANEEQSNGTPSSKRKSDGLDEPDPAYDPITGKATCKLLEVCSKASFVLTSVDPFKAKVYAQRVSLYWDYDLLVALFRSYLLGNAALVSDDSSTNSSRTNSGDSVGSNVTIASAIADVFEQQMAAPFGIELQVDRWYVYMRPQSTVSPRFALKVYGRDLSGNISTLDTPYLRLHFNAKGGVNLDSSCLMSRGVDDQGSPVVGEEACELMSVLSPIKIEVESAGYGGLEHRDGAGAYVKIRGSKIEVNYANAHYMVLVDHMAKQFIGFFSWVSVQMKPAQILTLNERTKMDAEISDIRLFLPRGAVGNATERQKKPERVEIDVEKVFIKSRAYPDYPRSEQLQILIESVQISTCLVDSLIRPHMNAVSSVDEAVSVGKSRHSIWVRTHEVEMAKSRIFHHDYVYIEHVAVPLPPDKKKKKELSRGKSQKLNQVLDIEDVMKELEKICGYVRVSLSKPTDWANTVKVEDCNLNEKSDEGKNAKETKKKKAKAHLIETSSPPKSVEVALDEKQLELLACILDENVARSELVNTIKSVADNETENKALDVQVCVGNISVQLLRTNIHPLGCSETSRYPYERIITQLDFENVRLLITGFSTQRAQYRVISSKATLYNVDLMPIQNHDATQSNKQTKQLSTCAEIYLSSEGENCECIDITVDQYPAIAGSPANPVDIRIHVDTCALSPSIIQFALRVKEFLFCKVQLPNYIPQPGQPVNLSVTTGAVHCMLAEYYPSRGASQSSSDGHMSTPSDNCNDTSLKLILTGCFVVRFNNGEQHLQHIQIFSRNMSIEVAAQWPPLPDSALTKSPSSPSRHLTGFNGEQISGRHGSSAMQNLSDYRRVLCEDFAVDLDLVDTTQADNVMKISASLTHFHAVLCVFDVFMLTRISENKLFDENYDNPDVNYDGHPENCTCAHHAAIIEVTRGDLNRRKTSMTIVNTMVEDFSVTFVREIGEYFTPVARIYSFCTMCNVTVNAPLAEATPNPALPDDDKCCTTVNMFLHFSEESATELRDDEGMSIWVFNTILGSWEPIIEPWTFTLTVIIATEKSGKVSTTIDLNGSDIHSLNLNFSPGLLDTFCAIVKEFEQLSFGSAIHVSTARVISCGFYLANDCGADISYWVSDHAPASSSSRGFSYTPRHKCVPELLLPRHKVPLKLSTSIFSSIPSDQTISFSWGDEDWHPLTDVRIHSAGKYVYSVLPKHRNLSSEDGKATDLDSSSSRRVLLALFDISAVFGYRTLTVSSLVRIFNDADIAVECGVLSEDGKTVTEVGIIEPHEACGVPITLIKSITSIRVLMRPHVLSQDQSSNTIVGAIDRARDEKKYRWSNELFISEKDESSEQFASCSLVLDDYDCKCQRIFDGSQPLHLGQTCRANGSFFRVCSQVFVASNASSLKYAQIRFLPPVVLENRCGLAMHAIFFVFKKVRRAGAQDREYFHIVASEKIAPRSSSYFVASSLHEQTYCSVSITGFSWSKLFLLPSMLDGNSEQSKGVDSRNSGISSGTPTRSEQAGDDSILCFLDDFKTRVATVQVAFHNVNQETHVMRKVIIQPRFVIHDTTSLRLTFEPHAKVKSKISNAKAMFSLSSASQKRTKTCCGSSQLELIHTKLNALSGASASGPISQRRQGSTSDQAEIDSYYLSETSAVNIQIEGNTLLTSGVSNFRLDSAVGGANSTLRLFDEAKKQWCDIVVILEQLDAGTTKVTFVERYLVLNRTNHHITCAPASSTTSSTIVPNQASQGSELLPRVTSPFHWSMRTVIPSDACIRLKIHETAGSGGEVTGWRWSGKFSLHDVSETALKLSNKYTNQVHVVRVEVRVESSVRVLVVITSEDSAPFPLYRIVNSSSTEIIHFKQSFEGGSGELSEQAAATVDYNRGVTQRLFPGESLCFGWDEAFFLQSLERTLNITYASATSQTKVLFDQPGDARRIELPGCKNRPDAAVYVHWYLNGMTKTVHVHDTELPRDKLTGKQDPAIIIAASDKVNSVIPGMSEMALHFKLPSMLLSILNSAPEEVLLLSAQDVDLAYAETLGDHDQCEVKVGSIQLDNQMENAIFPVIFTPQPMNGIGSSNILDVPRKSSISEAPPSPANSVDDRDSGDCFFHLSVFRLSYGSDVEYIKYLSAMLQPARLQVDDLLVVSIGTLAFDCMRVVQQYFPAEPNRHMSVAIGETDALSASRRSRASLSDATPENDGHGVDISTASIPSQERRMYIETLQLHPIKIILAFQQNDRSSKSVYFDDQTTILLPMVYVLLKSNLVNIDGASLNLNALHIFHSFTTRAFMFSAVQQHYTFQGILQIYALVGAADILGNPLGLVTNLGTGVKDFFYEPAAGMVKSPQEFVMGLSRGTASLVKNSVYGTFNAASKFTGTLSSGIAALSMDNDYVSSRNTRNRQEVATHIGTGLFYGTKQLGQGILAGVTGVITAPAMGAYNNGFTGFVEGVGRGLIGVAVKPTAGILDLAAKTTAGITATATVFDKKARNTRMRLPRMVHTSDRRIRVYSNDEALICQFLHRLPQKLRQNEHYEAHVFLPLGRVLVVTSHQLLHVDVNSITGMTATGTGQPRITWKYPLASVWGAQKTLKGVHVLIGTATSVVTPGAATTLTRSSMTTVLIPLRADVDAIHINIVIKCVSDLVTRHRERTPVLDTFSAPPPRNSIGLVLEPVRDGSNIPGYEGIGGLVVDVFVGSACFHAGLEVGDVIVGFGDQKMEPGDHGSSLRYQLSLMKKGEALKLMVLREGAIKTISVSTE